MIYLDNAATSFPKPEAVARAVAEAVTVYGGNPGRGGCPPSLMTGEKVYECRENADGFFGGYGAEYTVFTSNATSALNAAIFGVAKKKRYRGHMIITAFEHNSVLRPAEELKRSFGMEYTVVKPSLYDDEATVSGIASALRKDTVAVIMTHASNVCGRILPISRVGRFLSGSDITFIVDASQSAGNERISMKESYIGILCTAAHKGLMAPAGTGLMLLDPEKMPAPTVFGGTGSNSAQPVQPELPPERFESGTLNVPGILGLNAGINVLRRSPGSAKRERELAARLHAGLEQIRGVTLYTDYRIDKYVPTVCFNIDGIKSLDVSDALAGLGFATRGGLHCAPLAHEYFGTLDRGMTRVSIGFYNTLQEIDGFLNAVETVSAAKHG